jgi:hypothetical protein
VGTVLGHGAWFAAGLKTKSPPPGAGRRTRSHAPEPAGPTARMGSLAH